MLWFRIAQFSVPTLLLPLPLQLEAQKAHVKRESEL